MSDDHLDDLLRPASVPARTDDSTRAHITDLSLAAAAASRPRPRRSVRIAIGVIAGALALGGVTTAAALPFIPWQPPEWISSAEVQFDVILTDGVSCSIAMTAMSAAPDAEPGERGEAELAAAREILEGLDPTTLTLPPWGPPTPEDLEYRPGYEPEAAAYTEAISTAVWDGLVERGVLAVGEASSISVTSFVDCGSPE